MNTEWQDKIKEFCDMYNIPHLYLADVLYEPKVIPMIRGKAFEYSAMEFLKEMLPQNEWKIYKENLSEEAVFHDTDVRVLHKRTGKIIRLECKLAQKEGYRLYPDGHSEIRVKCMRSRTLGAAKVKELAPKLGVDAGALLIHNDQYLSADFDIVLTSVGNAFYRTDKTTGLTAFNPDKSEVEFLNKLKPPKGEDLKDFAYRTMYVTRSQNIAVNPDSGVVCHRKKCQNKNACGFIPDYPIIRLDTEGKPTNGWTHIEESINVFRSFLGH